MRLSNLFFRTLRNVPAEADSASHQLLLRAGYIRQVAAGIFDMLPLGLRVIRKLEAILREEMNGVEAQELSLPVVQPAELWRRSGRWDAIGEDLARFQDRTGRDLCLGFTHEEVITNLAAQVIQSYRQLPVTLYQFQTKFRDEPRPRGGLIRTREFTMKDAYSFHADEADFDAHYRTMGEAYLRIFERCALDVITVESDTGIMGGIEAHEFMFLTPIGEDTLLICPNGDYRANRQVARFAKPEVTTEEMQVLEEVATPDTATIDALTSLLDIPKSGTAKALFFITSLEDGTEQFVFAVVRGDMDLSETKLRATLGTKRLRPATVEEIRAIGAEPGYGSPIGIRREQVKLIVDDAVARSPNLVAGANRAGYHLLNTNHERDYRGDLVTDIAAASDGDACPVCGAAMRAERGVEVGNIFKLGTVYSEPLEATFLGRNGAKQPLFMGSYGIGLGRLMASIAEAHHDDVGLCWPAHIAPYNVMLIALKDKKAPEVERLADELYEELQAAGMSVLYDDRDESPGVKFKDADLMGLPLRVTVGRQGLERGMLELKYRTTNERQDITTINAAKSIQSILQNLAYQ